MPDTLHRLNTLTDAETGPRWRVDDALLDAIAEVYELPHPLDWRDLGGAYNLNLWVRGGAREIVARVHRPWVTRARLMMLHDVREGLRDQGLPVPEPLRTAHGETTWRYTDRWMEAAEFVPNDGMADTWERLETAFSLLGQLHDAIEAHGEAAAFVPPRVSDYALPAALRPWMHETERIINQAAENGQADADTVRVALETCHEADDLLGVVEEWWEEGGYLLPEQAVHGDYGGDNLLFRNGKVAAILDFDFLAVRERLFDVAFALYWVFSNLEVDRLPRDLSWDKAAVLLSHYNNATSRPLIPDEWDSLPLQIARVPLYWVAEAAFAADTVGNVAARAGSIRFAGWVMDNMNEVADTLMGQSA